LSRGGGRRERSTGSIARSLARPPFSGPSRRRRPADEAQQVDAAGERQRKRARSSHSLTFSLVSSGLRAGGLPLDRRQAPVQLFAVAVVAVVVVVIVPMSGWLRLRATQEILSLPRRRRRGRDPILESGQSGRSRYYANNSGPDHAQRTRRRIGQFRAEPFNMRPRLA
jgi:hypothetical protein